MGDCYNIIEGNNKNTNIKTLGQVSILKVRSPALIYYYRHREEILKHQKEYYQNNKNNPYFMKRKRKSNQKFYFSHKKEINEYKRIRHKKYMQELKENNPQKYLQKKLSIKMNKKITKCVKHKTKHTFNALNYTVNDLINHLKSKFKNSMTWGNYGKVWEIDHIIPISWFNYSSTDDYEFKQCWRLGNLQPKFVIENRRKHNHFADNGGQLEFLNLC